jgi:hypothetical protein
LPVLRGAVFVRGLASDRGATIDGLIRTDWPPREYGDPLAEPLFLWYPAALPEL